MSIILLWFTLVASAEPEMIPEQNLQVVGQAAPAIELPTLDGGTFKLEDHRGTPVVLSFWASWCGPCRLELPALSKMQAERSDVKIFAVNVDPEKGPAEGFLRKVDVELPIVWDNKSEIMGYFNVMSMPTMFVIDGDGTIKWRKSGFSRERGLKELEDVLAGMN